MSKGNLPRVMRPVTAQQLVRDSKLSAGKLKTRLDPTSTALGNTVTYVVPVSLGPGPAAGLPEQNWLDAYSGDLYPDENPWDGKNWILSGGVSVDSVAGGNTNIEAFKVRILFGSGGALQEVIVNAAPQFEMSLPANTVKATIFTGPIHISRFINAGTYKFVGMLHRGIPNGDAEARILTLEDDRAEGSVAGNLTVTIPAFAKRLQLMGSSTDLLYAAPVRLIFEPSGLEYSGPELLVLKNAGTKISIPAGSGDVRIINMVGALLPVFSWDIEI